MTCGGIAKVVDEVVECSRGQDPAKTQQRPKLARELPICGRLQPELLKVWPMLGQILILVDPCWQIGAKTGQSDHNAPTGFQRGGVNLDVWATHACATTWHESVSLARNGRCAGEVENFAAPLPHIGRATTENSQHGVFGMALRQQSGFCFCGCGPTSARRCATQSRTALFDGAAPTDMEEKGLIAKFDVYMHHPQQGCSLILYHDDLEAALQIEPEQRSLPPFACACVIGCFCAPILRGGGGGGGTLCCYVPACVVRCANAGG